MQTTNVDHVIFRKSDGTPFAKLLVENGEAWFQNHTDEVIPLGMITSHLANGREVDRGTLVSDLHPVNNNPNYLYDGVRVTPKFYDVRE